VARRFFRDHALFVDKLNQMIDTSDLLVQHLNAVLLTLKVPVDIGNYPDMVTSGEWSDDRIKIKNTGNQADMVLALIFEGFNALSADAYKALDVQFDNGRMTLRDYGRRKAEIEANVGYPRLLAEIRAGSPNLALSDDADKALARWDGLQHDEGSYNAWFVDSPHGGEHAVGRARLSSADLYAYEKVMLLNKGKMARTMNLLVGGQAGPGRSFPAGWITFQESIKALWEGLPQDCGEQGSTKKPAAFLHIGNTARNRWPEKNVNLMSFGFSAMMITQAYKENAGYGFPVIG
jgi:hypothetical protein